MAVVGAGLVLIAVVLVVMQSSDDGDATTAPFAGSTLNIILGDYSISGDLTAPAGEVRLQAVNNGGLPHNVGVRRGPITGNMAPGKGGTVDLGVLAAGTYELYCDIGDHVQRGMVAELIITEPLPGTSSSVVATS